MKYLTHAAFAALLTTTSAFAHDYKAGNLSIVHPMAFETAQSANVAGGYMTIENSGETTDRLLEVRVPNIRRVELHLSETDANGVARMTKQDGIEIPAGETVTLQPGGLHMMFMGLNGDPFEEGEKIDATLVFESAGEVDVVFNVEARSAADHGTAEHSGH
jgi:copper(I)-binding protein